MPALSAGMLGTPPGSTNFRGPRLWGERAAVRWARHALTARMHSPDWGDPLPPLAAGVDVHGGAASLLWGGSQLYSCSMYAGNPSGTQLIACAQWCRDQGVAVRCAVLPLLASPTARAPDAGENSLNQ